MPGGTFTGWETSDDKTSAYFDSEKNVLWMKKSQKKTCTIDTIRFV